MMYPRTAIFLTVILLLISAILLSLSCAPQATQPSETPNAPPTPSQSRAPLPESTQEVQIPSGYTTYKDESQLFSISYPSDWEPALSILETAEQMAKDWVDKLNKGIPIEKAQLIFLAGLPSKTGYQPNVNIVIEPIPTGVSTLDQLAEAEVRGIKLYVNDYREISRVKTSVDGREAVILRWQGTINNMNMDEFQLILVENKVGWVVTCATLQGEYTKWEKDFETIVRSFRILE
jgi:hypothetical protein